MIIDLPLLFFRLLPTEELNENYQNESLICKCLSFKAYVCENVGDCGHVIE